MLTHYHTVIVCRLSVVEGHNQPIDAFRCAYLSSLQHRQVIRLTMSYFYILQLSTYIFDFPQQKAESETV
jgi:hypothetical protein